ncbi:hypothetical protein AAG570_002339 [Ranatra chinensis]|uniref:Fatty acid desaturase domain-containing protein n=1 Tax=Ranatra chinensis TaxID=642074 RepID=A0ABD0YQ22_9HEMI
MPKLILSIIRVSVFISNVLKTQIIGFQGILIGNLGGFGVTAGAHRLWAHRSYKAKLPLEIILIICFSISGQNSVFDWVRDHRVHHKFSETDADPHNARRGFFFSHVGWLMRRKHSQVIERGKRLDMTDVLMDPVVAFHTRHFIGMKIFWCFLFPTIVPPLFWSESWSISVLSMVFVRYVLGLNFTWLVNSAAHMWGNKPYDRRINPAENAGVAFLSLGEGWHNYHHVFPWDYKAGELGAGFNLTTLIIDAFASIGWAYDLKQPSQRLVRAVANKYGDGSGLKT